MSQRKGRKDRSGGMIMGFGVWGLEALKTDIWSPHSLGALPFHTEADCHTPGAGTDILI